MRVGVGVGLCSSFIPAWCACELFITLFVWISLASRVAQRRSAQRITLAVFPPSGPTTPRQTSWRPSTRTRSSRTSSGNLSCATE
ncbi:hypothetical protein FOCC_FOCC008545 [Frankliniella occidentalis]|nr:hypothetical protein FOCC_FOCC008545 [Frankliniella occidentalis]